MDEISVQPEWCRSLPLQQQSVLFLAGRGPDGIAKHHPCKAVHRAYRATIFKAGRFGRLLRYGEKADSFMSLDVFADEAAWGQAVKDFFAHHDELPHHYMKHLMHGVRRFYDALVVEMHLNPESEAEMDKRLGDWDREGWDAPS